MRMACILCRHNRETSLVVGVMVRAGMSDCDYGGGSTYFQVHLSLLIWSERSVATEGGMYPHRLWVLV